MHWAISLTTTPRSLTATASQTRRTESDFEDFLVRKYADRMIKLLIANGPVDAALAGRLQARLPSQPPIVFVNHDARPVPKSTGHTYR